MTNRQGSLIGQRVSAVTVSNLLRGLCGPDRISPPQAKTTFSRGAGFVGHHRALEHEVRLLTAVAQDRRTDEARIRAKLQGAAANPKARKSPAYIGAKVSALQNTLQKAADDAAYFERQALRAQSFLAGDTNAQEASEQPPPPADSLDEIMVESSQERASQSLLSLSPSQPPSCEAAILPSVSPFTQSLPHCGASSRLSSHGGIHSPVDSASAPRNASRGSAAGSPAPTQPRSPTKSPAPPQRSPAVRSKPKHKPVPKTRVKAKAKGR